MVAASNNAHQSVQQRYNKLDSKSKPSEPSIAVAGQQLNKLHPQAKQLQPRLPVTPNPLQQQNHDAPCPKNPLRALARPQLEPHQRHPIPKLLPDVPAVGLGPEQQPHHLCSPRPEHALSVGAVAR